MQSCTRNSFWNWIERQWAVPCQKRNFCSCSDARLSSRLKVNPKDIHSSLTNFFKRKQSRRPFSLAKAHRYKCQNAPTRCHTNRRLVFHISCHFPPAKKALLRFIYITTYLAPPPPPITHETNLFCKSSHLTWDPIQKPINLSSNLFPCSFEGIFLLAVSVNSQKIFIK